MQVAEIDLPGEQQSDWTCSSSRTWGKESTKVVPVPSMLDTYHVCAKTVLNEDAATTEAAMRALYFILEFRDRTK